MVEVATSEGTKTVSFDSCIIAAGSQVARIPGFPYDDPRLMDSTSALELKDIPKRLLVIGGGIIGLEMATVYDALGSRITVVELLDGLIPGADRDIIRPLHKRIEKRYEGIYLKTKVTRIEATKEGLKATFEGENAPQPQVYDRVLLSVGRRPNGKAINAEAAGVLVNERGYIPVDKQMRTNVPHIFAIGDIVGEPMLAHKASYEGKLAAEVIAGHRAAFDARTIPSVAYTDPEVAWMGLTETAAKAQGIEIEKAVFPVGRERTCACHGARRRADQDDLRQEHAAFAGRSHRRTQRRRIDRRDRAWRWRWVQTQRISGSPSTRIQRCRRRCFLRPRSRRAALPICTCPRSDFATASCFKRATSSGARSCTANASASCIKIDLAMSDPFIPLVNPPDALSSPAMWFAFQGAQLLIRREEGRASIPSTRHISDLGLEPIRSQYLGSVRGQPLLLLRDRGGSGRTRRYGLDRIARFVRSGR